MADAIREIMCNHLLQKVEILSGRYVRSGLAKLEQLSRDLPLKVTRVNVKGKFCWIELDGGWIIAITFGMAGGIYYEPTPDVIEAYASSVGKKVTREEYMKHFNIRFSSETGESFYFGDPRHFGTISLTQDRKSIDKKLASLGPDMLTGPPITDAEFIKIFRGSKFANKNICKVLMDQHAVAGVGNYIKAEVLYAGHINPWALVSDLDDATLTQLHQSIRHVALMAYESRGASLYTYTGTRREKGEFQDMLKVYGKERDPEGQRVIQIPESESPDKRTTHYVPSAQTIGAQRDPRAVCVKLKLKLKSS